MLTAGVIVSALFEKDAGQNYKKPSHNVMDTLRRERPSILHSLPRVKFGPFASFSETRTAKPTSTGSPQNNRLNEQKQSLCTCILHFDTISLPSSAKQQRELAIFYVFSRTWVHDSKFFFLFPYLNAVQSNLYPGQFASIFHVKQIGIIAKELPKLTLWNDVFVDVHFSQNRALGARLFNTSAFGTWTGLVAIWR